MKDERSAYGSMEEIIFSISRFQKADQIYLRKWRKKDADPVQVRSTVNSGRLEKRNIIGNAFVVWLVEKYSKGEIGWPRIPGVAWFTWNTSRVFLLAIVARDSFVGMRRIQGNFFGMAG